MRCYSFALPDRSTISRMNPTGHLKVSLAFFIWLLGFAAVGGLIGHWLGLIVGLIIAFVYALCAVMAPDKLPIDIYEGRLMMREEDSALLEIVDDLAVKARIPAPDVYILALDQPNVLAWATSNGKTGFSRIGIATDLRSVLSDGELQAVMAVAVALNCLRRSRFLLCARGLYGRSRPSSSLLPSDQCHTWFYAARSRHRLDGDRDSLAYHSCAALEGSARGHRSWWILAIRGSSRDGAARRWRPNRIGAAQVVGRDGTYSNWGASWLQSGPGWSVCGLTGRATRNKVR